MLYRVMCLKLIFCRKSLMVTQTQPAVAWSNEIPYVPKNKRTNSMTQPFRVGMIETHEAVLRPVHTIDPTLAG